VFIHREESVINLAIVIPENHIASSNITPSNMLSKTMPKKKTTQKHRPYTIKKQ
jgi:hypothetical protein